ncbi:MAG: 2OG-Fe(II) oxygenase family protein [Dongiaceae bacterium]
MRVIFRQKSAPPTGAVSNIFATPLINRNLAIATPDFLAELRRHILNLERIDRGRTLSNFGGWHSSEDFFSQNDGIVQNLAAEILKVAAEMSYEQTRSSYPTCAIDVRFDGGSWANVSRHGDYNKPHSHPGVVWSGVFYVSLGDRDPEPRDNGCIEFIDPRPGNIFATKFRIDPKPGQLLLFPSWLYHYVNPFRGGGERISVAFNTNVEVHPAA